jgi:hypothetical protein
MWTFDMLVTKHIFALTRGVGTLTSARERCFITELDPLHRYISYMHEIVPVCTNIAPLEFIDVLLTHILERPSPTLEHTAHPTATDGHTETR